MKEFRLWLAEKVTSLAYRFENRAERLHDLSIRIRPQLRYEDMDEFQQRCHNDASRLAGIIMDSQVPNRSPYLDLIDGDFTGGMDMGL